MTDEKQEDLTEYSDQQSGAEPEYAETEGMTPDEPAAAEPEKSGGGKLGVIIAIILALIALLLAGFVFFRHSEATSAQSGAISRLNAAVQDGPAQVEQKLESRIASLQDVVRSSDQRADRLQGSMAGITRQIASLTKVDRTDWLLAEVEYLVRLAVQRLQMEDDISGARSILENADQILKNVQDPRLHGVRKALTNDIADLRSAGEVDVEGIYLTLAAQSRQIDALPLIVPSNEVRKAYDEARVAGTGLEDSESVEDAASKVWDRLSQLVVVRHREDRVAPLLPPEQEYYLRQNLRMLIEQGQLALLRKSQPIYKTSLESGQEWLQRYFPEDASQVQAMQAVLQELLVHDVGPREADISASVDALQTYLADRHLRESGSSQGVKGGTQENPS